MYPAFLSAQPTGERRPRRPHGLRICLFCPNFSAGLTNYGTTPAPMFFAQGYVPLPTWWKIGFVVSLVNIAIWSIVGFSWWKSIRNLVDLPTCNQM